LAPGFPKEFGVEWVKGVYTRWGSLKAQKDLIKGLGGALKGKLFGPLISFLWECEGKSGQIRARFQGFPSLR